MTKPKMTKIECLEKMVKIWRFLEGSAIDWIEPRVCTKIEAYAYHNLSTDLHYCPCCEYVSQYPSKKTYSCSEQRDREVLNCALCPLKGLWDDRWGDSTYCEAGESPYNRWQYTNQEISTAAAKEIADYSENLLHKLEEIKKLEEQDKG